jgi:hypothetical protein
MEATPLSMRVCPHYNQAEGNRIVEHAHHSIAAPCFKRRRQAFTGKVHYPNQNQRRYRDTQKNQRERLKIEQGDFYEKKGTAPEHRKDDQQPPLLRFH